MFHSIKHNLFTNPPETSVFCLSSYPFWCFGGFINLLFTVLILVAQSHEPVSVLLIENVIFSYYNIQKEARLKAFQIGVFLHAHHNSMAVSSSCFIFT